MGDPPSSPLILRCFIDLQRKAIRQLLLLRPFRHPLFSPLLQAIPSTGGSRRRRRPCWAHESALPVEARGAHRRVLVPQGVLGHGLAKGVM